MSVENERDRIIGENYDAFEALLPSIISSHAGEYALLRDKKIIAYYPSAGGAQMAGLRRYPDGAFSVQKVEQKAIDLGFYSHARYRRVA